jgi:hypothetical protein
MLDWGVLVSERLGALELDEGQREEIARELAGHLEDFYVERCSRGASKSEAMERTLAQVADWQVLTQKIRLAKRKEESMNDRTKGYWLPGLIGFTASMVWLMILQLTIPRLRIPWYPADSLAAPHVGLTQHSISSAGLQIYTLAAPYLLWLVAQPAFGALAAYLSRRGGGERGARLVAGVFPALMFLCALSFVALMAVFVERNQFVLNHPLYFATVVFPWVVFPAAALSLGVLPFVREPKAREI